MFTESAIAGEAAGIAIGLVSLGTMDQSFLEELIRYAHETRHEKIIRGLAIGFSLMAYSREQEADVLIEQLCSAKVTLLLLSAGFHSSLRWSTLYCISLLRHRK